jgi:hypothetical protein
MIEINYQKRKNTELFKSLEDSNSIFLSKTQNYIPIYKRFFSLNETNYNNINLNHKWYISSVKNKLNESTLSDDSNGSDFFSDNLYKCNVKNITNNKTREKNVFFKMAPLLDPYKYLIGKYDIENNQLFKLPDYTSDNINTNVKFNDVNNSAYVDGFFLFLNSLLIHNNNFIHGVDYYGSFLAIKNDFKINVFDDIEYLNKSDFFQKNKNKLFTIEDYEHLFQDENTNLKPIKIEHNLSSKSQLSIHSFNDDIFEDVFENNENNENYENLFDLNDLKEISIDLNELNELNGDKTTTIKSNSTCSSRTSHTSIDELNDCENCDYGDGEEEDGEEGDGEEDEEEGEGENDEEDDEEEIDENIELIIPKFPIQLISMEHCESTFDDLILSNELSDEEWYSAFMQIIMILITFQKSFSFTHNDLHTNNVMYNTTDKKYIYYCYKNVYYKVPTFGRLFKIIDFGRSIYKFNGQIFCSDSFQTGGDASTQYNTEPYFNEKKPRLEPNFSFDICRLACSIFDYVIEDVNDIKKYTPIQKLILEWCCDDNGSNLLYKTNGNDRYPDFKLYKMIARHVHNHTPQAQLERPEFKKFSVFKDKPSGDIVNIDNIPVFI